MVRATILALPLAVLAASPLFGQEWAKKMFETTSHDFGTIARGAKAEYEFVLKNIYMKDVHVAGVQVSCGCTTPRIEKPLLKTYEKGAVVASINSKTFLGRQSSTITVTIDKPRYARVRLHVKVFIQPDVVLQPASIELGSVDRGTAVEKKISVSCTRRSNWKIVDVKSANPHLSGEVVETSRRGNRVSYELSARLDKDTPAGYIKDHLILSTNDQRSAQIPVLVEGLILPEIMVSPASLFFGAVPKGQKVTKRLVVRGKTPFRVTSITSDCDCLQFDVSTGETPKPLHLIPVTFTARDQPGRVAASIRIQTDRGNTASILPTYSVVVP